LKRYKALAVKAGKSFWTDAGVGVERNDKLLIMASGTVQRYSRAYASRIEKGPSKLLIKIGDSLPVRYHGKFYVTVKDPGKVKFMVDRLFSGSFRVDIFVIAKENEIYLSSILTDFLAQNPRDQAFKDQVRQLYLVKIDDIKHKPTAELQKTWKNTISDYLRTNIVWELEKRGAIDSLIHCLSTFDTRYYAFAESWDTDTLSNYIDILDSIKRLESPEAIHPVSTYLDIPKFEVRWHALDTLAAIKSPQSVDAISAALTDPDEQIRLKAVQSLENVGNPKAIEPLSILLSDDKKAVRVKTELALKKLGASEDRISDWKQKSKSITLDDLHREKQSYQKALSEQEKLKKALMEKFAGGTALPPILLVASPEDGLKTERQTIRLSLAAEDDQGLDRVNVFVNERRVDTGPGRGIEIDQGVNPRRLDMERRISLDKGVNHIRIRVTDTDGLFTERTLTVHHVEMRRRVWAVVIGIDAYLHVRKLKYAVNDAQAFYDLLVQTNQVPPENVFLMVNRQAGLKQLRSTLGSRLKSRAGKDDMVIIYFAGHGATERDMLSPDGDGLEKYLLPYDADPNDLYASALPMREIAHIFHRIRSERLVFIVDACYSGASGGRTISVSGIRANLSDAFLERIAGGKGKIIITASSANEVSVEKEELGHGVFTYFMVKALRGEADTDQDGVVTVDEAYYYVSDHVTRATGQEQHPVKKGAVEGRVVLSVVQ
jgi:hypothetical protein